MKNESNLSGLKIGAKFVKNHAWHRDQLFISTIIKETPARFVLNDGTAIRKKDGFWVGGGGRAEIATAEELETARAQARRRRMIDLFGKIAPQISDEDVRTLLNMLKEINEK